MILKILKLNPIWNLVKNKNEQILNQHKNDAFV